MNGLYNYLVEKLKLSDVNVPKSNFKDGDFSECYDNLNTGNTFFDTRDFLENYHFKVADASYHGSDGWVRFNKTGNITDWKFSIIVYFNTFKRIIYRYYNKDINGIVKRIEYYDEYGKELLTKNKPR